MHKINIPNLTLVCIDCRWQKRTNGAILRCLEHINYGDVKIFTSNHLSNVHSDLTKYVINIKPIKILNEYSRFIFFELGSYIKTSYVLIIQYDGYILNPYAWNKKFLAYDYIGAPWHFIEPYKCVGNGGFSIRSTKLLKYLQNNFKGRRAHQEDAHICREYREELEKAGFTFAPVGLAKTFSVEAQIWDGQFGFHNPHTTNIEKWSATRSYQFNIITRTSNRPKMFRKCVESIRSQSYKNIRHIVSVDDDFTENYVKEYQGLEYIRIDRPKRLREEDFPYNLYLNNLIDKVKEGWIFILDDDDYFCDTHAVKSIINKAYSNETIVFTKMRWRSGKVIPSREGIHPGDIGSCCFCFNLDLVKKSRLFFDRKKCADYRFIHRLNGFARNREFLSRVIVELHNDGAKGDRKDL